MCALSSVMRVCSDGDSAANRSYISKPDVATGDIRGKSSHNRDTPLLVSRSLGNKKNSSADQAAQPHILPNHDICIVQIRIRVWTHVETMQSPLLYIEEMLTMTTRLREDRLAVAPDVQWITLCGKGSVCMRGTPLLVQRAATSMSQTEHAM